jgi:hypothetical protein
MVLPPVMISAKIFKALSLSATKGKAAVHVLSSLMVLSDLWLGHWEPKQGSRCLSNKMRGQFAGDAISAQLFSAQLKDCIEYIEHRI